MKTHLKEHLIPLTCFMAGGFLLFLSTFGHQWTYDDYPVIVRNLDVRSWSGFLRDTYPGRPLRELSFMLDYTLFGFEPRWYHLQNIFWHGLNGFLLFRLVRSLNGSLWLAWTSGLIFLCHPLTVEVVANTSHRKDSLMTAFCLLSALLFLRSYQGLRGWLWLLAALACAVIACFAKQTAIAIFVVLLAYDLFLAPTDQRKLPVPVNLKLASGGLALVALVAWYSWLIGNQTFQSLILAPMETFGVSEVGAAAYFAVVFKSLSFMFLRLVFPVNLAVEYDFPAPQGFADPWVLITWLLFIGVAILLVVLARRRAPGFLMMVWAAAFWLPTSNLLYPLTYFAADRYLYAPLAGFAVLAALAIGWLLHGTSSRVLVAAVVVVVLAVLSWQQTSVWQSGKDLFVQALKVSPNSVKIQEGLASEYINSNELDKALGLLTRAYETGNSVKSIYLLGLVYERKGVIDTAIKYYKHFVLLNDPRYQKEVFGVRNILRMKYRVNL